jgi:hypothetical protein
VQFTCEISPHLKGSVLELDAVIKNKRALMGKENGRGR